MPRAQSQPPSRSTASRTSVAYRATQKTLMLLSVPALLSAQAISGRATDVAGKPIPAVSVTVDGTTLGTTTRDDGSYRIDQVIYVRRPGQRAIVLGDKGQRIKNIGARARAELERLLDRRVHLFLFVKVRDNWIEDPERFAALGLDYNV